MLSLDLETPLCYRQKRLPNEKPLTIAEPPVVGVEVGPEVGVEEFTVQITDKIFPIRLRMLMRICSLLIKATMIWMAQM